MGDVTETLKNNHVTYKELDQAALSVETAKLIAQGKIIGWFQGAMEWGPRALGNRSILADPRRGDMKDILNARIKHREKFRPFRAVNPVGRDRQLFRPGLSRPIHDKGIQYPP